MFTTPVSMKIPSQQDYEKDLKQQLSKLGYKLREEYDYWSFRPYLITRWTLEDKEGKQMGFNQTHSYHGDAYKIHTYNPQLFLALAGLTDDPAIKEGDWVRSIDESMDYRRGMIYRVDKFDPKRRIIKSSTSSPSPFAEKSVNYFRKATKEELIQHFEGVNEGVNDGVKTVSPAAVKPMRKVTDLTDKQVIHCPTQEEAEAICKLMHNARMTWRSGDFYLYKTNFHIYDQNTCYSPKKGGFCYLSCYENNGYEIFPAKDFLPPQQQNNKSKDMKPRILSHADFKRIHAIACKEWQTKLAEKFKDLLIEDEVEVDEEYYKLMRGACTVEQHKLFDEIFGKDVKEVDLYQFKIDKSNIRSGGKYAGKGFVLNNAYKWKIVQDGIHPILIPE